MDHSFLSLHIGQAGVQIGQAVWELMCIEHNIRPDGALCSAACYDHRSAYNAVFCELPNASYLPRAVFVDSDAVTIDELRIGQYKDLFTSNQLLSAGEDAAGNFMLGRHLFEKNLIPLSVERTRWMLEMSDSSPTILAMHSGGGGTGSGVTAACLRQLHDELSGKLEIMELTVMPSGRTMVGQNEIINSALYHRECSELVSVSLTVHNGSLFDVCKTSLGVKSPTFAHINRVLALGVSNLTATERYPGSLPCSMSSISTNLLPFANLKYPVLSCCPFVSCNSAAKSAVTAGSVTKSVFDRGSQFADVDPLSGKLMSCALIYRGNAGAYDVNAAIQSLKASNVLNFVDWCPIGFKVGIVDAPPISAPLSGMGNPSLSATMISNCTAISSVFNELAESIGNVMSRDLFMHHYSSADSAQDFQHQLTEAHDAFAFVGQLYSAENYSQTEPGSAGSVQQPRQASRLAPKYNANNPDYHPYNKRRNLQAKVYTTRLNDDEDDLTALSENHQADAESNDNVSDDNNENYDENVENLKAAELRNANSQHEDLNESRSEKTTIIEQSTSADSSSNGSSKKRGTTGCRCCRFGGKPSQHSCSSSGNNLVGTGGHNSKWNAFKYEDDEDEENDGKNLNIFRTNPDGSEDECLEELTNALLQQL